MFWLISPINIHLTMIGMVYSIHPILGIADFVLCVLPPSISSFCGRVLLDASGQNKDLEIAVVHCMQFMPCLLKTRPNKGFAKN